MQALTQSLAQAQAETAFKAFDHFLNGAADLPIAVAVSGGGDSIALLLMLRAWGKRPLEVFHVDHGINPLSGAWCDFVAALCQKLNLPFTALKWEGEKPATGLSAKARTARLSLIFDAMRARGLQVLCLGHTTDDVSEAMAMRMKGSNVTAPQIWSPAPLWPKGRGLFCFRPLLSMRREALRHYLRDLDQDWIDDPSNSSGQNLRSRVRLAQDFPEREDQEAQAIFTLSDWSCLFYDPEEFIKLGYFRISRAALSGFKPAHQRKIVAAAIVCAGGGNRLPRKAQVETVLGAEGPHTLCGSKIWDDGGLLHICRSEHDQRAVQWFEDGIIDGRFSFTGLDPALIMPLHGHMAQLLAEQRPLVMALPPSVRASLPVHITNNTEKVCLAHKPLRVFDYKDFFVTFWVPWRLRAALGLMGTEADIAPETQQVLR